MLTFCFSHPSSLKYSQYSVFTWKGVIKASLKKKKKVTLRSLLSSTATAVSHQSPAVLQHSSITSWFEPWDGSSSSSSIARYHADDLTQSKAHSHRQQRIVHPPSRERSENTARAWLHLVCSCWHLQKCFYTNRNTDLLKDFKLLPQN